MLKYQNVARVGERVRSYSHRDRQDCYVEGTVERLDTNPGVRGYAAIIVRVDSEVSAGRNYATRVGTLVAVPMEMIGDYDGRVVNLSR